MADHDKEKDKPDDKGDKRIEVTVRTPGNTPARFEVKAHDRVDKVTGEAVTYFVGRNELAPGEYGLALVRNGQGIEMNDAGRLEDYGIVSGDELHLINRAPQVDG